MKIEKNDKDENLKELFKCRIKIEFYDKLVSILVPIAIGIGIYTSKIIIENNFEINKVIIHDYIRYLVISILTSTIFAILKLDRYLKEATELISKVK